MIMIKYIIKLKFIYLKCFKKNNSPIYLSGMYDVDEMLDDDEDEEDDEELLVLRYNIYINI